ncbi:MAG: class I SAM-dependent methyltransferase [Niastella sp.]|nr:class I SAM-dependent methyltransferase [Niastella sp.]
MKNFSDINKTAWNKKVPLHVASDFYDMPSFLAGKNSLNKIELDLLGDVKGKSILHLQCHFGQDSISLSRMGAKVTGVDFSDVAITKAKELSSSMQVDTKFICADIFDLPDQLFEQFDIVFSSYGTIGWFPDINKWAMLVTHYLKPGGRFIFAEFHPVVWMYDNDFTDITYSYFNGEPIEENLTGTYAAKEDAIATNTITWNHGLAEVIQALLSQGLQLCQCNEYNYSPYDCLSGMEEFEKRKYRIAKWANKIPLVYALAAEKKTL